MLATLNLNLIIPFKDNKAARLTVWGEVDRYKEALIAEAERMRSALHAYLGSEAALTLAPRSDGHTKKYFWRLTSSTKNRKYCRLTDPLLENTLSKLAWEQRRVVQEYEREIIGINANLRILKGLHDSLRLSEEEFKALDEFVP